MRAGSTTANSPRRRAVTAMDFLDILMAITDLLKDREEVKTDSRSS